MGKKKAGTTRGTQRKAKNAKKRPTAAKGTRVTSSSGSRSSPAASSKRKAGTGKAGAKRTATPRKAARKAASRKVAASKAVTRKAVTRKAVSRKAVTTQGATRRASSETRGPAAPVHKGPPRSLKHVEALAQKSRAECHEFLESGPLETQLVLFDESYPADLVNVLLDLKKATVKRFFEVLRAHRKRALAELVTLYYYREYLTNPLPLQVETLSGASLPNYYAILGVPREATEEELRIAHRLLGRAYSPESFSPAMRAAGAERLTEIDDAFDNLKTPGRREHADRLLPNINYLYPRRDQSWLELVQRILG